MASYISLFSGKTSKLSILAVLLSASQSIQAAEPESSAKVESDVVVAQQQGFVEDSNTTYGPISKTDTLWQIAVEHRPDTSVSNYQVMMAIFNSNPNAFLRNDVNGMIAGQFLRIPSLEEIKNTEPYRYNGVTKQSKTEDVVDNDVVVDDAATVIVEPIKSDVSLVTTESTATESQEVNTTAIVESPPSIDEVLSADSSVAAVELNDETPAASFAQVSSEKLILENQELKESLNSVDNQLTSLQYEMAKTTEKQIEIDQLLTEQKALMALIKDREMQLVKDQQELKRQREGIFYNPMSYWTTTGVLAVLISILFYMVSRRRQLELVSAKSNSAKADADKKDKSITKSTPAAVNAVDEPVSSIEADIATLQTASEVVEDKPFLIELNTSVPDELTGKAETFNSVKVEVKENESIFEPFNTLEENEHVESAFSSIELLSTDHVNQEADLDLQQVIASPVANPSVEQPMFGQSESDTVDADKLDVDKASSVTEKLDDSALDIDDIIDGMLDDENKPATLRSTKTGNEKSTVKIDSSQEKITEPVIPTQVNEIEDYDDVEFDKLLAEISAKTDDFPVHSNVVSINSANESQKEATTSKGTESFISVDELIEESENATVPDETYFAQKQQIDVGLHEFPDFQVGVNHVNVDDDKHGVSAKLDLAQVYIEIGDTDNASVILKNIMKLGNSSQQQKAQQLLYSLT